MNLLHVTPYYAPAWRYGGVVRMVTDLTRAQVAAGHRVFVLTTDARGPGERALAAQETIDGVQVTRVHNRSAALRDRLNLSTPRGITHAAARLIREHAIDAIHCHELRTVEALRVAPLANRLGVPLVVSAHGTLPYDTGQGRIKRLWDRLFAPRLLPRFDRVIALTAAEADDAQALWSRWGVDLPETRISVVPNGVHLDDFANLPPGESFRTRWKVSEGPLVLFLARLHERKGAQFLIPAFAQARDAAPDARLVIAGPDEGMLAALQRLAHAHNVAQHVTFTGMLAGNERLAALSAADVFALPAVGEGFSMAVLEALACGLPVVLTPGCHFPEAEQAGAGVVVERAVEPLAGALRALLADADRRTAMGGAARSLVERCYTWPQVVAQLDDAYRAAIDRREGAA